MAWRTLRPWPSSCGLAGGRGHHGRLANAVPLENGMRIRVGTSTRIGEVLALRRGDVDVTANPSTVHITGRITHTQRRGIAAIPSELNSPEAAHRPVEYRRSNDPTTTHRSRPRQRALPFRDEELRRHGGVGRPDHGTQYGRGTRRAFLSLRAAPSLETAFASSRRHAQRCARVSSLCRP